MFLSVINRKKTLCFLDYFGLLREYSNYSYLILLKAAFVQIDNSNQMGLVHISQISNSRVDNIRDYLNEGDRVKVKVIEIKADGKIGLSIKQAR